MGPGGPPQTQPQSRNPAFDDPNFELRERAVMARQLGTAQDFGDDETAYFRAMKDFKAFAAELGVTPQRVPDINAYMAALEQAAEYYKRSGRLDDVRQASQSGASLGAY